MLGQVFSLSNYAGMEIFYHGLHSILILVANSYKMK